MNLLIQALPDFLDGLLNTIIYCAVSFPLALLLGFGLAQASNSTITWLNKPARIYIEVIRSTPMIAQIFLIYYGLSLFLAVYGLAPYDNAWTAGIATLALNYSAYEAEVFRAGFASVNKGQGEAALSLGLTERQSFFRIVFPQSIPLMIPPFANDLIYMLKDSAIVSVIGGFELTSKLNFWRDRNGSNLLPIYFLTIVCYLILSLPISYFARSFERRLRAAL